jgi:hypothetical protein
MEPASSMNGVSDFTSLSTLLRPAAGVRLFLVRDSGFLFDEIGQQLFHLDTAATCVWNQLQTGCSVEELVHSISPVLGIEEPAARLFVLHSVRHWWRLGLVDSRRRLRLQEDGPSQRQATRPDIFSRHHYCLLETRFSITCPSSLQPLLVPVLAHLETTDPFPEGPNLTIVRTGVAWHVLQGREVLGSCEPLQRLAPTVYEAVNALVLRKLDFLLALRAAGIERDGRAMLLVGESRSGKTVLTAAMLQEGWDYLSDDVVLLDRGTCHIRGLGMSLALRRGGWELISSRVSDHQAPRQHLHVDGQIVSYLPPPPPKRSAFRPRAVAWIVFLRRVQIADAAFSNLRTDEGLRRLMEHLGDNPKALLPEDIHRLIEWSSEVQWFELKLSDLGQAVASLHEIAELARASS